MKIGIGMNPYSARSRRLGDEKFFELSRIGFSAVDYCLADTETELYTCTEAALEKSMAQEKESARNAEIEIAQVHGPWRYPPRDATDEDRAERLERMKRSLLATHLLGCRYWVVHPIMPFGIEDLLGKQAEATWEENLKFLSALLPYAKSLGVTICLENMPMRHFSIATPLKIRELVNCFQDDSMKICLDTGHVAVFPELNLGEQVRALGADLKTLHVHDNRGDRDAHLWPTKGILDWQDFVEALENIGFGGVFSLETAPSDELDDESYRRECRELFCLTQKLTQGR